MLQDSSGQGWELRRSEQATVQLRAVSEAGNHLTEAVGTEQRNVPGTYFIPVVLRAGSPLLEGTTKAWLTLSTNILIHKLAGITALAKLLC